MYSKKYFRTTPYITSLVFLVVMLIGFGCGKGTDPDESPSGRLTGSSGCISYSSAQKVDLVPPCCTGMSYKYFIEDGTLTLEHFGAGFNCCAEASADITFEDSLILIREKECGPLCDCLCLFNVDYQLKNISPGTYTIRFIEPYATDEDTPLEMTFDLNTDPTGSINIERNHYPWDDNISPVVKLVDYSDCGGFQSNKLSLDSSACLYFNYDGDSILTLLHVNAVFNCCPDTLWADINYESNVVTIEEKESLELLGGCHCLCKYDLDYRISDLLPGFYTIRIVEPYLHENYGELVLSIGLYSDTSGSFCVDRPYIGSL